MNNENNNSSFFQANDDLDDLDLKSDSISVKEKDKKGEVVIIPKTRIDLIKKIISNIQESSAQLGNLLSGTLSEDEVKIGIGQLSERINNIEQNSNTQVIEGVFDGESMIGPDGKQYSIPANYASKSKLVEGDILKLTITETGTFVYKQIGPIDRKRVVGHLEKSGGGNFLVRSEGKTWRVITASVTYYKGEAGDEIVILVPKLGESKWAAVENVVKNLK